MTSKQEITKELLVNMLWKTQDLEKEIEMLENPSKTKYLEELKKAQDIASWDPSQENHPHFKVPRPTQEDKEWAYKTMEKLAIKCDNYDSGLTKYLNYNGELLSPFQSFQGP